MGLDMYLTRKTYVKNWNHTPEEEKTVITVNRPHIDVSNIVYIEEEIGYWRKANQIHQWFVDNVQKGNDDCGTYYVSKRNIKSLLRTCKKVMAHKEKAPEYLPVTSGCFFGSMEYDEWYFQNINNTIEICEAILKEDNKHEDYFEHEYFYMSSW